MRNRGEPNEAFPGRPDDEAFPSRTELRFQSLLRCSHLAPAPRRSRHEFHAFFIHKQQARFRRSSRDHDGVKAGSLSCQREARGAQAVVDPVGQRGLRDDGELGRRRQRTTHEWTEGDNQRCFGRQRIHAEGSMLQKEPRPQSHATQVGSQNFFLQRNGSSLSGADIDPQIAPMVAVAHHPAPCCGAPTGCASRNRKPNRPSSLAVSCALSQSRNATTDGRSRVSTCPTSS